MPKYKIEATAVGGEIVTSEVTASDEETLMDMLRTDGYYLTKCTVMTEARGATHGKIKNKPLAYFCSQLSSMLKSGLPISKSLEIMADQTEDIPLKFVLEDVSKAVKQGNSMSEAFYPHRNRVDQLLLNMIETGESTGNMDQCLFRAGEAYTKLAKIGGKVKSGMVYPAAILILLILVVTGLLAFVVPQFVTIFENAGVDLPFLTRMLLGMSDVIINRWWLILIILAGVIGGIKYWLSTDDGRTKFDTFKINLPMVGKLIRKIYASRFARSFASLNSAGVPMVQCVRVTARVVQNRYIEKLLYDAVNAVEQGGSLGIQLEKMGVFPPILIYITKVGEETGSMEELYLKSADFFDEEADNAVNSIMALMQPAIIVALVILVAPILLGIILPMFGMFEAMMAGI